MPSYTNRYRLNLNIIFLLSLPSLISTFTTVNLLHNIYKPPLYYSIILQSQKANEDVIDVTSVQEKKDLLKLLQSTPTNTATSSKLTDDILSKTKELEDLCPTPDNDVLSKLAGNWELLWTAQDKSNNIVQSNAWWRTYINPLENQSYSNNPTGRLNPVLPRDIQDKLEKMGILSSTPIRSSQSIDINKKRVRNVVTVSLPFDRRASLIVDITFEPNASDLRRVDVKFNACTLRFSKDLEFKFPLGFVGPTGWLRTTYVDEEMRITRGFKGSVFILVRPSAASSLNKRIS